MSSLLDEMYEACGAHVPRKGVLVLEDGSVFEGTAAGAEGEVFGEVCFNTSLEGYLEIITDPSYAGQVVVLTYPQIGNYGVNLDDVQSDAPALSGLVVRELCHRPSNWRSTMSLPAYLERHGVVCLEGVDTRALVRHIRETGAQRCVISTTRTDINALVASVRASAHLEDSNQVERVSCHTVHRFELPASSRDFAQAPAMQPEGGRKHVVAYDCGAKRSILEQLYLAGCDVDVVPWDTPAKTVLAMNPDGVFFSNGPGDPVSVGATRAAAEQIVGKVPVFGICLGHQMLSLAAGGTTLKLKYGHRGGNQPVQNLLTGRVEITAQNHGFGLEFDTIGPEVEADPTHPEAPVRMSERFGRVQLTHVNLNDGTCEGIRFLDVNAFSVQYHPEANPGPTDSHYLFTAFVRLMDGRADYLDIDIARNRLAGWDFKGAAHA